MLERMHKLIRYDQTASAQVLTLLDKTFIGTEGTLYQLKNTAQKIKQLHQPHFFSIERNNKAIANVTLCERPISLNNGLEVGYYIRYFAFDSSYQRNAPNSKGESGFHTYFKSVFATRNLNPSSPEYSKSIFWAYVDPQNKRSSQMTKQFGFVPVGQFKTKAFSRAYPKNKRVERLQDNDKSFVLNEVRNFYSNHSFFSTVHLFENDNYFVLKKNGEIIAGIQANPVHWEIKSLPGKSGSFMIKYANRIPIFKRLFNPKKHLFLATEALFWTSGNEKYINELLEGVLAITTHNSLLIWEDNLSKRLDSLPINWGLIQRIKKDNSINIIAKFNDYTQTEIEQIKQTKKYISGFDVT